MYKIKVKPIEIQDIMDVLISKPYYTTTDNVLVRKAGMHLKQMRKDKKLIIANDRKTGESFLTLRRNPLALHAKAKKVKGRRTTYEFDDFFFVKDIL